MGFLRSISTPARRSQSTPEVSQCWSAEKDETFNTDAKRNSSRKASLLRQATTYLAFEFLEFASIKTEKVHAPASKVVPEEHEYADDQAKCSKNSQRQSEANGGRTTRPSDRQSHSQSTASATAPSTTHASPPRSPPLPRGATSSSHSPPSPQVHHPRYTYTNTAEGAAERPRSAARARPAFPRSMASADVHHNAGSASSTESGARARPSSATPCCSNHSRDTSFQTPNQRARPWSATTESERQRRKTSIPTENDSAEATRHRTANKFTRVIKEPQTHLPGATGDETDTVGELLEALEHARGLPMAERKRFFFQQCLKWHPDKNLGAETNAKCMFQLLQEKKEWLFA